MSVQILTGDCRAVLKTLADESVHCVVTSPPYFGLRSYLPEGHAEKAREIGLELTPDAFVSAMAEVFREVRRVLRADGTLWLNLGDSYANDGKWGGATGGKHANYLHGGEARIGRERRRTGLKPKDLIGIPWRVAFALQADGWWLRQDIIWHKPNPMPESITDRCTKAHEYLFLLTKGERYAFDAEAIAEGSCKGANGSRFDVGKTAEHLQGRSQNGERKQAVRAREIAAAHGLTAEHIAAVRAVGITDVGKARVTQDGTGKNDPRIIALAAEAKAALGGYYREFLIGETRNKRSVWTVATAPFSDAHFATFPPDLIVDCIKAGCPVGGTVLDPFGGAGTTGLVAQRLKRNAVLIELNAEYAAMAERRIAADRAGPVEQARIRHAHKPADLSGTLFGRSPAP